MVVQLLASVEGLERRTLIDEPLVGEFTCAGCEEAYRDGPPLITLRMSDGAELPFCGDDCAEELGYVDAVLARKRAEARGDGVFIVYLVPEA